MEPRSLTYIAASCGGETRHATPEVSVRRVCSDTRQVGIGDLFAALPGDRFDGHNFLGEAAQKGATALLVERGRLSDHAPAIPTVVVDNTRKALGRLAAAYRGDFAPHMIAVGGSNGKTTTKELLASVLQTRFPTLRSPASFNNDIGVPHTLLQLESHHRAAVLEVGTNHPGELAPLLEMIRPRFGVITSIGREHLEFFGDLDGVAREEGALAEILPADGALFINGDAPQCDRIAARTGGPVVTAGFGPQNQWQVTAVRLDTEGTTFAVKAPRTGYHGEFRLRLLGRHQAVNATLAMAVASGLGLDPDEIRRGLACCEAAKMRLEARRVGEIRLLDDTYNANADSVLAALAVLNEMPCAGRRVAVLGDMAELGPQSAAAHADVGRQAAQSGLASLFTVGPLARTTAEAARAFGLGQVLACDSVEIAAAALKEYLLPGDLVLLKASRSARLERIGEALSACSST